MNKKICIIVMAAAVTIGGSSLLAVNWFKSDKVKPIEKTNINEYEKQTVDDALNKHELKNMDNIEKKKGNNESVKNIEKVKANVIGIEQKNLKDGEYFGVAKGFRGNIKVKTVIKNGKLNEIKLVSYNDDEEFMKKAKAVINNILAKQKINGVDTVSGATYSSKGILEAISNSISKSIINNEDNQKVKLKPLIYYKKEVINNRVNKADNTNKTQNINKTDNTNKTNNVIKNIHNIKLKDGEYFGVAKGFRENVKVKIVIKDGKINQINLLSHNDDEEFMKKAKIVINDVLAKQNVEGIDTVSGATYSSKGILEAISNSISKAIINNESPSSKTAINTKKEDGNEKIAIDTKKEDVNNKILKTGVYIGRASGFDCNKFIETKVTFENNKIKNIEVSNKESTYGDSMDPYRETAVKIVDEILKDQDKTINDVLEYDRIVGILCNADLKNNDGNDFITKVKKLIGDYSKEFNNIKERNNREYINVLIESSVKKYLKSKNKGQALDTVSGATYSAIGIVKSVKNAMYKSQNDINIRHTKILGLNNNTYKITIFDKKGEDKKLDLSSISLEIHYMNGQVKVVPFNEFTKNNIKVIDSVSRKPINLNMKIKDLKSVNSISIIDGYSLDEQKFILIKENIDTNFINKFQYSIDNGQSWQDIKDLNIDSKGNLSHFQYLTIDESFMDKILKVRLISKNNNIYYLTSEEENKISLNNTIVYLKPYNKDVNNNKNIFSAYNIKFKYNLPEEYKPIIIVEDKIINQGEEFNPLKDVKVTNKKGENLIERLQIRSNVQSEKPGKYIVEYSIDKVKKEIFVTVKEINKDKKTELIVSDKIIRKGAKFNPKDGIKAISKTGKDITDKIKIASEVKTNKVGKYDVTYLIRDFDKVIMKIIKVTVVD